MKEIEKVYGRASVKLREYITCHLGFLTIALSLSFGHSRAPSTRSSQPRCWLPMKPWTASLCFLGSWKLIWQWVGSSPWNARRMPSNIGLFLSMSISTHHSQGSFHSHHIMLAIDYIKLFIFEIRPIFLCDFNHMIIWCHTYSLHVEFGVIYDVVHFPPYSALFLRPSIHTLDPLVAFVDIHVKREISTKWPTTLCLLIELLEYLRGEFGIRALSLLEERCDSKCRADIWVLC